MKTINELNQKIWYRTIKVIFIFSFLFFIIVSVVNVFNTNTPRQVKDFKIECRGNYTNQKSFFAVKDAGFFIFTLNNEDVYQALTENNKIKIRSFCDITKEETEKAIEETTNFIKKQEMLGVGQKDIQNYIDSNLRPYTIAESYFIKGSYFSACFFSLLTIAIIFLIMEIIKRIFYYIFLGKINPSKK